MRLGGLSSQLLRGSRRDSATRARKLTIFKHLFKSGLCLCKWCLLLGTATVLALATYFYTQLDNEIRRHVEQLLGRHYSDLVVSVRSAQLVEDHGIELRGLTLTDPHPKAGPETMISVDQILLACKTDLRELALGKTRVTKIIVRRPRMRAVLATDGTWNVGGLLPLPRFGDGSPDVEIHDAVVELVDTTKAPQSTVTLRGVRLTISPDASGEPTTSGQPRRFVQAQFSTAFARRIDISGTIDPETGQFSLSGKVVELAVGEKLRDALPATLASTLANFASVDGRATVDFKVQQDPAAGVPLTFAVNARLERGRLVHARLPYPLTDLTATIHCTDQSVTIEQLSARYGQSIVRLSGRQNGLRPGVPLVVEGSVDRLVLDRDLFTALPGKLGELWKKFQPAGVVNVNQFRLTFDGQKWTPEIALECLGGSFTYDKFPYPLVRTTGAITLAGNHLSLDLVAHTTSRPVTIKAELDNPGPRGTGWIDVRGENLRVDERVILALPAKGREVVSSLKPAGTVDVAWYGWRKDPDVEKLHSRLDLTLRDCSIRYDKFAYPLSGISGTVKAENDHWSLIELTGKNDSGTVTCNGTLTSPSAGRELTLVFVGQDVPLEDELRDALPEHARGIWNDLKPQGRIDLTANVRKVPSQREPEMEVWIEPRAGTVSIKPVHFSYRMDNLQGRVRYSDRHVEFYQLRAEHGRTTLSTDGSCKVTPDGWQLAFTGLAVDRLSADVALLTALPPELQNAVDSLNLSSPVNLRGSLQFSRDTARNKPMASAWNLSVDVHQSNVDVGVPLSGVSGRVDLRGWSDGETFASAGQLAIDSLNYLDHQFTAIRGPIWLDKGRVLLGTWAAAQQQAAQQQVAQQPITPQPITGRLYGGSLNVNGWVILDDVPRYEFNASLARGDLARFAKEGTQVQQQLRGNVKAELLLKGTGRTVAGLTGEGTVEVRETNIYELPLIVEMLGLLRGAVPDAAAFTKANMKFRIRGENISFDQLDLIGDAISLNGSGQMNFDQEVKFVFGTVVGPSDSFLNFRKLLGGTSRELWQIHVTGPLENPEIRTEMFPRFNQTLQQFQTDTEPSRAWTSRLPDPRRMFSTQREQPLDRK